MSASANAKLGSMISPSFTTYSRNRSVPALPRITQPKRPEFHAVKQHCLFTTSSELGFRRGTREDTGLGITGGFTSQFASMYRDTSLSSLKQLLARAEMSRACAERREQRRQQRLAEREKKRRCQRQRRLDRRRRRRQEQRQRAAGASVIQHAFRMFISRNRAAIEMEIAQERGVQRLQAWFRLRILSMRAKAELRRRQDELRQRAAIYLITRTYVFYRRRVHARAELARRRAAREAAQELLLADMKAANATKIQSLARGMTGRKRGAELQERREQLRIIKNEEASMRQRIESDLKKQQKERARVLEMQQQMKAKKDKVRQDD